MAGQSWAIGPGSLTAAGDVSKEKDKPKDANSGWRGVRNFSV
jgi:hypothetical protein